MLRCVLAGQYFHVPANDQFHEFGHTDTQAIKNGNRSARIDVREIRPAKFREFNF